MIFEGGGSPPHVGTVLHLTGLQEFRPGDASPGLWAGMVLPSGEVLALRIGDGPPLGEVELTVQVGPGWGGTAT